MQVVGRSSTNKQFVSNNITVAVGRSLFELKVQPTLQVIFRSKSVLKITARRKAYQGPIALELSDLPARVKAAKVVLPAGQSDIEVEIDATDQARRPGRKWSSRGPRWRGQAARRRQVCAARRAGPVALKVEPAVVKLTNGGNARVKVLAMRKGYEGAIAIELCNLPNGMTADKVSIGKREDRVEIEIKAGAAVGEGDRVDVYAIGTPVGITKRVESPRFTVSVDSVGQPPGLELASSLDRERRREPR